jgi:hypothetical protein
VQEAHLRRRDSKRHEGGVMGVALQFLVLLGIAASVAAGEVEVTIDAIVSNELISGKVTGLPSGERETYRVVIYIRTDQWYIHPYASGGDGRSYASISASGDWKIKTVRREFPAEQIAALVVPSEQEVPVRTHSIAAIKSVARIVRDLKGTPEYGSL